MTSCAILQMYRCESMSLNLLMKFFLKSHEAQIFELMGWGSCVTKTQYFYHEGVKTPCFSSTCAIFPSTRQMFLVEAAKTLRLRCSPKVGFQFGGSRRGEESSQKWRESSKYHSRDIKKHLWKKKSEYQTIRLDLSRVLSHSVTHKMI